MKIKKRESELLNLERKIKGGVFLVIYSVFFIKQACEIFAFSCSSSSSTFLWRERGENLSVVNGGVYTATKHFFFFTQVGSVD